MINREIPDLYIYQRYTYLSEAFAKVRVGAAVFHAALHDNEHGVRIIRENGTIYYRAGDLREFVERKRQVV